MTFAPMPAARAVSERQLAETCALDMQPKMKAPVAIKNVAPYLACGLVVAKNMMYLGKSMG